MTVYHSESGIVDKALTRLDCLKQPPQSELKGAVRNKIKHFPSLPSTHRETKIVTLAFDSVVDGGWRDLEMPFFCWRTATVQLFKVYQKKTQPTGRMAMGIVIKKKTFSRWSRKLSNLYPTHTKWHHSPRKTGLGLRSMFWHGTDVDFFLQCANLYMGRWGVELLTWSCPRRSTINRAMSSSAKFTKS